MGSGAVTGLSAPSYAQVYEYPPPPADIYSEPWVGPNTPWVYYNGDWFLNGILYFFFGPEYGWCPYYAYPPTYIVRPHRWYAPLWLSWYQGHPVYWQNFQRAYPYWRGHAVGHHYDLNFYEQHHRGQGGGWQKGFQGRPAAPATPGIQKPGPARVAPPVEQRPAPTRVAPPERPRPAPAPAAPPERPKPGPAQMAPPERPQPGPARMAPPEGPRPGPAQMAPPAGPRPGPAQVAPPAGPKPGPAPAPKAAPAPAPKPAPGAPGAPQPEKGGGHGEEKH